MFEMASSVSLSRIQAADPSTIAQEDTTLIDICADAEILRVVNLLST